MPRQAAGVIATYEADIAFGACYRLARSLHARSETIGPLRARAAIVPGGQRYAKNVQARRLSRGMSPMRSTKRQIAARACPS
jgi:hypothetical protein